jgi:cell division septation protein DedD
MTLEDVSRSAVIGLSMLASTVILGVVISAAYRSIGYGVASSASPLIRMPQLTWKLPAARRGVSGPDASELGGLDRLLPAAGDEPRAVAPDQRGELPPAGPAPVPAPSAPPASAPAVPPAAQAAFEAPPVPPPASSQPSPKPASPSVPGVAYRVQLLATQDRAAAERASAGLHSRLGAALDGLPVHVEKAQLAAGTVYRLQIGSFDGAAAAAAKCAELKRLQMKCFVLRIGSRP